MLAVAEVAIVSWVALFLVTVTKLPPVIWTSSLLPELGSNLSNGLLFEPLFWAHKKSYVVLVLVGVAHTLSPRKKFDELGVPVADKSTSPIVTFPLAFVLTVPNETKVPFEFVKSTTPSSPWTIVQSLISDVPAAASCLHITESPTVNG